MNSQAITRFAVEGIIAAGKTSLAQALAHGLQAQVLSEDDLYNPFLEKFYADRQRWALACQLQFLDQRLRQFSQGEDAPEIIVADHTIDKEMLYAQVNLDEQEFDLYQRMYQQLAVRCAFNPQLIIYLASDVEVILERIHSRGRHSENFIDEAYLYRLRDIYHAWFTGPGGKGRRVVVVDSDATFISRDPQAMSILVDACRAAPMGVSYCNPVA
ncbi:MAG: deoxynucleoside kinase [Planctomycetota bacterium]|nr:MAG: deoxynucleoside kinase [Planctomycetota bacterium]